MIEIIENGLQLAVTGVCAVVAFALAYRSREKEWDVLALFYSAIFLGDLYWQLYMLFNHTIPDISYVSEFSWYAAYMFLLLLLRYIMGEKAIRYRRRIFWIVPPFVIGMALFYMRYGDYLSNVITAFLMGLLIWHSLQGIFYRDEDGSGEDEGDPLPLPKRRFCAVVLTLCLIEYTLWTFSCFFSDMALTNPYYWADFMFTATMAVLFPLFGKAVNA